MKIEKEGRIEIGQKGEVLVTGFTVRGGNAQDLAVLVRQRIAEANSRVNG